MKASTIQLLPEKVISQIAAAEVVQRPAAVVKELLENAIDAHSTSIQLVVEDGGKQLIQVIDDGDGMGEEDAARCFERHATSKISSLDDLFNIQTLGFRGEALASIAAVAQVELITKRGGDELGTKVTIQGGKLKSQEAVAAKKGTQITVKNIFFNIPARRNFLKATPTETKYVIEEFQRAAITHPEISFSYWQNGHQLYSLPATKAIQRIVHIFGENYQKNLIRCQETTDTIALSGYVGAPSHSKKTRGGQFLFVNNRYVKSAFIHHAVKKAFEGLIVPDTFPFYILNLTVPRDSIDVHVHPMKTEVKFEDESIIYTLVSAAIKKALAVHHIVPSIDFDTNVNQNPLNFFPQPPVQAHTDTKEEGRYAQFKRHVPEHMEKAPSMPPAPLKEEEAAPNISLLTIESGANEKLMKSMAGEKAGIEEDEKQFFCLHNTYIFTSLKSGMLVIDLKAAYERILYERYGGYLKDQPHAVQKLLFPIKTELNQADYALLEDCKGHIEKLGFRLEMTPPTTVVFTAQPSEAKDKNLQQLLEELIEQYKATSHVDQGEEGLAWARSLAKRIASHKRKKKLTPHETRLLVDQLFACEHAHYTPEGRRTWYKVSSDAFAQFLMEEGGG